MAKEFVVKRCKSCGATVKVFEDCTCDNCGIVCCGEQMEVVTPNSVDASAEKHVPICMVENGRLIARVPHVMEEDHYIEWIALVGEDFEKIEYFKPGDEPVAHCRYSSGIRVYAWCNKHLLWYTEVE